MFGATMDLPNLYVSLRMPGEVCNSFCLDGAKFHSHLLRCNYSLMIAQHSIGTQISHGMHWVVRCL